MNDDYILVYENINGVGSGHLLFKDANKAEEHFLQCLLENTDLTEEQRMEALENGSHDDANGYEVIICWPERHWIKEKNT